MSSKYQNAQIYKIVDSGFNKCYIGHTSESLSQRMARHKYHYTAYLKGTHKKTRSFELFDEYGIDNCRILWIEDYSCNNKKEIEAREGHYIETTNCVNKTQLGRTKEQWFSDNRDYVLQLKKDNYQKHKDGEEFKQYNQQKSKQYFAENKDEVNERRKAKIECPICSSIVRKDGLNTHQKSKKHLNVNLI